MSLEIGAHELLILVRISATTSSSVPNPERDAVIHGYLQAEGKRQIVA